MGRQQQLKATKREIRRAVGDRVVDDFNTLATRLDEIRGETLRAVNDERTHRLKLADEQRRYVDGLERNINNASQFAGEKLMAETAVLRRGFFGRLKWLVFGR